VTTRSIPTIDPGGAARRRGAEGQGIVIALMSSGIELSIDGSISAARREPEQIAEMIVDRLRSNRDRGLA
jgi:hypothetical protein